MSDRYTHEVVHQIWDDKSGDRIEVGPDRDGLDLVEVRGIESSGRFINSIVMTRDQAILVCKALTEHLGLDKAPGFSLLDKMEWPKPQGGVLLRDPNTTKIGGTK